LDVRKRPIDPTGPKTFGQVATELMDGLESGWRNAKHRQQWRNTLKTYGLARRIHEHGIPATQAELVREMLSWFEGRSDKEPPDESTVRRKITAVWRELHRA
jgi:hypothetical protein